MNQVIKAQNTSFDPNHGCMVHIILLVTIPCVDVQQDLQLSDIKA